MMLERSSGVKLHTPIDLVLPSSFCFISPPQLSTYLPASPAGQWIRYRSTYSRPSRSRLALRASWEAWNPWSSVASLVVTKISARGMPDVAIALPTAASLPYAAAVSSSRMPTSSASPTARSVSASESSPTPMPSAGSAFSSLRATLGIDAAEVMSPTLCRHTCVEREPNTSTSFTVRSGFTDLRMEILRERNERPSSRSASAAQVPRPRWFPHFGPIRAAPESRSWLTRPRRYPSAVATKPKKTASYDLKAADRRRNMLIRIGLTAVIVIFAVVLVGYIVLNGKETPGSGEAKAIRVTSSKLITKEGSTEPKVVLSMYEDFLCPVCQRFEADFGPTI